MSDDREERIRNHAYRLWEQEGHPDGRHDDHWRDATVAIDGPKPDEATPVKHSTVEDEAVPATASGASPVAEKGSAPAIVPAPPAARAKRTTAATPRKRKTPARP